MRRALFVGVALVFFAACNNDSKTPEDKKGETPAANDITQDPVYQKGLELIAQSDCLTCHSVEDKINGPSYREVANKYANLPDTIVGYLARKIIHGVEAGTGIWGDAPMTPHSTLSQQDAEALAKYVLLFKK